MLVKPLSKDVKSLRFSRSRLQKVAIVIIICISTNSYTSQLPTNFTELPDDVQALLLEYAFFADQVTQRWGDQAQFASSKAYVKYLDDYLSRSRVDFASGSVIVETLAISQPKEQLTSAIVTTLLTPDDPNAVDIFSANDIKPGSTPFLLGQVVDHQGQNIRYQWRARQFANHLIDTELQVSQSKQGVVYRIEIPMVSDHNSIAAKSWLPSVRTASNRYNLPESLILGIIETESNFNLYAVSPANAYGLMQIVSKTAGADVFQKVFKKSGRPSRQYLFNAQNNIMVGSAYLMILRDNYLSGIKHPTSQLYCIISAYNSGAGNVLNTFSKSRRKALQRINRLSPSEVLWHLQNQHPSLEARRYVKKVLSNQIKYVNL